MSTKQVSLRKAEIVMVGRYDIGEGICAAILAGGRSRRMGRNKALLEIGGQMMLERVAGRLRPLFRHIMIAGGDSETYGSLRLPVYPDLRPGIGSLGGIYTALAKAPAPKVFCTACDMPFLEPSIVTFLAECSAGDVEAVIPRVKGELEPLCAVYSTSLLPLIARSLDTGGIKIKTIMSGVRSRIVEECELLPFDKDLVSFFNINDPDDLMQARRIVADRAR